jgi:hypothetical protein
MRMRLAYCAAAVSPSSADAYYEPASFVRTSSTCHPHSLYYSSITNWIGVVPCLSGFMAIMPCALYCGRNKCMNITERDSIRETPETRRQKATFSGVHLEGMQITCPASALDLNHLPDSTCNLRDTRDQYHITSHSL